MIVVKEAYMLNEFDLTTEEYREYDWSGRIYRIDSPQKLFIREGGSTHRIVDSSGIAHCVPSVGIMGCVLRWKSKGDNSVVSF